jgi:hypothetical protein
MDAIPDNLIVLLEGLYLKMDQIAIRLQKLEDRVREIEKKGISANIPYN